MPKRQNGGTAPAPETRVKGARGQRELTAQERPPKYERAHLGGGWLTAHAGPLATAEQSAREAARRSGKPWTLEADKQTRAILDDFPARTVKAETVAKYRADYDRLRARGVSPLEAATTQAHWQRLRTACRYCMAEDVRRWRAASERARKAGDMDNAQRMTAEAHRLAVALDNWFCQPRSRLTWAAKAKVLAAQGTRPKIKSRRRDTPPSPDLAVAALLFPAAKGGPPGSGGGPGLPACRPIGPVGAHRLAACRDDGRRPDTGDGRSRPTAVVRGDQGRKGGRSARPPRPCISTGSHWQSRCGPTGHCGGFGRCLRPQDDARRLSKLEPCVGSPRPVLLFVPARSGV